MKVINYVIKEPLLHFLLLGGGLFLLFNMINGETVDKPNTIIVTPGKVEQLSANYSRTWQRPPTEQELDGLIESYLRDEVFYREAIALGLDKDDDLVRRRMRQKLEFIFEDVSALMDPSDEQLANFMNKNEDKFRLQPRISFSQVYLSPDKREDVETDAEKILARLNAEDNSGEQPEMQPEQQGDQIMLGKDFKLASLSEIQRSFDEVFARELMSLPVGIWSGPVVSGYGAHLVLVSEMVDGRMPALSEVREEVQREWLFEQRNVLKDDTYQKLLQEYEIILQQPNSISYAPGSAVAATRAEAGQK